jgi:hypothetical protein
VITACSQILLVQGYGTGEYMDCVYREWSEYLS